MNTSLRVLFLGRRNCSFSEALRDELNNCGWKLDTVWSRRRGERLSSDVEWWEGDYIFSFRSYFVLKDSLLKRAKIAAINFHPGPPKYRGSGCLNYALYNGEQTYGVTCHHMAAEVDSGGIIDVDYFDIFQNDNVERLLNRTTHKLYNLAIDLVAGIRREGEQYIRDLEQRNGAEKWGEAVGSVADLNASQFIDPKVGREELAARCRAYHTQAYPLKLDLHGYVFTLDSAPPD